MIPKRRRIYDFDDEVIESDEDEAIVEHRNR